MLETFRGRVFVKVSDNPHIKVLAGALFPSSVIDLRKISMASNFCNENHCCLYYKVTSSFVRKNQILVMEIIDVCITK